MSIPSFVKIFHVGSNPVRDLFNNPVEITEKVDGSQFGFGQINGQFVCRSKGREIHVGSLAPTDMFTLIVDKTHRLFSDGLLPEGWVFYGEYLRRPKHNTLAYERAPKGHIALYGAVDDQGDYVSKHDDLASWADRFGVDVVPLLWFPGSEVNAEFIRSLLDTESFLGGQKIEGVVVKSYTPLMKGSVYFPITCAKLVSERFKEQSKANFKKQHTPQGNWEEYKKSYCAVPRWEKAVQHLKEDGKLLHEPKDIGPLIAAINDDIKEECKEDIKDFLWATFAKDLLRSATRGFPEWYKNKLLESQFEDPTND